MPAREHRQTPPGAGGDARYPPSVCASSDHFCCGGRQVVATMARPVHSALCHGLVEAVPRDSVCQEVFASSRSTARTKRAQRIHSPMVAHRLLARIADAITCGQTQGAAT